MPILIPGGGLTNEGDPTPWVQERLDRAAEVYRGLGGTAILMPLSAGTPYRPSPVDGKGFPTHEATANAQYLIVKHEIPPEHIRPESFSLDTIGNAAFARWMLTDPNPDMRDLLVVTSEFHMPRTEATFRWIYGLEPGAGKYRLSFETTPDTGLSDEELAARTAKEAKGLQNVHQLAGRLTTMRAFNDWLFTEHGAYAARRSTWAVTAEQAKSY